MIIKKSLHTVHRSTPQCHGQMHHNLSTLLYYVHVHRSTTAKFFNAYFSDA